MITTPVLVIALASIFCSVNALSDKVLEEGQSDNPISSEIWQNIRKIRSDLQKMKADNKVDDQKLIADVQSLVRRVQDDLKNSPSSVQTQVAGEVTAIQSKITQMTTSGTFDPTVLQLFKEIAKAVSGDKNGRVHGNSSNSKNATNTS